MKVTDDLIVLGQSRNGAWSRKQLELLGVEWPPQKGWRKRILGDYIQTEDAEEFVSLRDAHLK